MVIAPIDSSSQTAPSRASAASCTSDAASSPAVTSSRHRVPTPHSPPGSDRPSAVSASEGSRGSAETEDWTAEEMREGRVVAAYGGGCLWAGDPDGDDELEALVLGASVKFTTGFTAVRE